ncbi:MAG TPA: carbohydrate ABC transporter permease [Aggregatilineales bacterium]|nr:carbohydrate ABC transporter permease [Aggregatilineales bacterium]
MRDSTSGFRDLSPLIKATLFAILAIGAVVMILPFVWMLSTACKPPSELISLPIRWIPEQPVCASNLQELYQTSPNFNRYLLNSALVTVGRTVGQLITCALAAYGFARFKFPLRNVIFAMCLGLLMVPFQAIVIPEFILVNGLGWHDTFAALIVPGTFSAFAMFLLRQAFLQIPVEFEEAAMIDGANPLQILWGVILPLSLPALAAFAVITMQAAWNDFLWPLVITSSPATTVVTVGLALLQGQRSTPFNLLMMGAFLASLPILVLFVVLQRYFIEGVMSSGLNR